MKVYGMFLPLAVSLLVTQSWPATGTQGGSKPQDPNDKTKQETQPKIVKFSHDPYPEEALKNHIEGKVELSITVDAKGRVSDARVLSGPPELYQAAIDSVKQWIFEPPANPPVELTADVSYGSPKECPGPISDRGEVGSGGFLTSNKGTVISWNGIVNSRMSRLPPYFGEERKNGIAGEMRLAITVSAKGKVTKIRVVNSLSPRLDKAAVTTVRKWRFSLARGNAGLLPDEFELPITYRAMCDP